MIDSSTFSITYPAIWSTALTLQAKDIYQPTHPSRTFRTFISCSENVVPEENSRNCYMRQYGSCGLPEYGGRKKFLTLPAIGPLMSGPLGCPWEVWVDVVVSVLCEALMQPIHTLQPLSQWVDLTRSTLYAAVRDHVWKHGTVTWISSGISSLHILFNSLYTNNPTMQLLYSLSYWKHS